MPTTHEHDVLHDDLPVVLTYNLALGFERMVLEYQDRIYAFACRMLGSPRDAEEVAQDAFVRAYRALVTYPPERIRALRVRPWLYQIALNVARNRLASPATRAAGDLSLDTLSDALGESVSPPDPAPGPERAAEAAELRGEVGCAIATLAPQFRVAVVLRHVEGFHYAEIAELLGQPIGTVKANIHRGTRQLRERLRREPVEV